VASTPKESDDLPPERTAMSCSVDELQKCLKENNGDRFKCEKEIQEFQCACEKQAKKMRPPQQE